MIKKIMKKLTAAVMSAAMIATALPVLMPALTPVASAENAPGPTLDQIDATAMINSGYSSMAKIVDGSLYVWGSWANTGISSYEKDGVTYTSANGPMTEPVKVPDSNFDSAVVQVCMNWGGRNFALTENGTIYRLTNTVTKVFESEAGKKIVYLSDVGGRNSFAKDEQGNWYSEGISNNGYFTLRSSYANNDYQPIDSAYYTAIGNRKIKNIVSMAAFNTMIICEDGHAFMVGSNEYTGLGNGQPRSTGGTGALGNVYDISAALGSASNPVLFVNAWAEDVAFVAVDTNGNVWGWGCDHRERFKKREGSDNVLCGHGYANQGVTTPTKFYNAEIYGAAKKALKAYITDQNAFIITADNSVYATGANTNQMITTAQAANTNVYIPTQIMKSVSEADTIVGLAVTTRSVTAYTLNGDSYFTGNNDTGLAGKGDTESTTPGEATSVVPASMPPTKPVTKNRMFYEIEVDRALAGTTGQTKTYKYRLDPTDEYPNRVKQIDVASGNVTYLNDGLITKKITSDGKQVDDPNYSYALPAGQTFKLNVYFDDFGKLHTWLVPIRFDPTYVKVVKGNGDKMPDYETTATVGKDGAIEQLFTSETWQNGRLAQGSGGTYPKVDNGSPSTGGWVSVLGTTPPQNSGTITGETPMFSVKMTANGTTPTNVFTAIEIAKYSATKGFDVNSRADMNYGAYWQIANPNSEDQISSYEFDYDGDFKFGTVVKPLQKIALKLTYGDGNLVDDADTTDQYPTSGGNTNVVPTGTKAINNKNKDMVYTLTVETTPSDASFPQVWWGGTNEDDFSSLLIGPDDGVTGYNDYITIIEKREKYIKFKLPDNFSETRNGLLNFRATSKVTSSINATLPVLVKSFDPPSYIHIKEKQYAANTAEALPAKTEFIYHNKIEPDGMDESKKENKTYTVEFPDMGDQPLNKQVEWSVLDKNGDTIDTTKEDSPIRIKSITPASGTTPPQISIEPMNTTFGDDYVVLRVASLYDPTVYDEAIIKVQFYAYEMSFSQEIVRIPTGAAKDLESYLKFAPNDIYEKNVEWSYEPIMVKDEDGSEYPGGFTNFNGTGMITANDEPTPLSPLEYEKFTATDTVSGLSATIKVQVISLDTPLVMDDITVGNNLGTLNDWVKLGSTLQVGDVIKFYKNYDDESPYLTIPSNGDRNNGITEIQAVNGFPFPVGTESASLLKSEGGEFAVSVSRIIGDNSWEETSKVPVTYPAEPSKVYGYVSLVGKSASSTMNQGIRIELNDPAGIEDTQVVTTDINGRFEFTSYIKPGTYYLSVSQNRYLTRNIMKKGDYMGLTIPAADEFCIASQDQPIKLYPGDCNMDGIIDYRDLDIYLSNWVGQNDTNLPQFDEFDFDDSAEYAGIGTDDLTLMLIHYGWPSSKYANWTTPKQ